MVHHDHFQHHSSCSTQRVGGTVVVLDTHGICTVHTLTHSGRVWCLTLPLCPSNAYVQSTLDFGSVNFRTVDFGGAFFNWSYCVQWVLSDTWILRCMMFIFCVKETDSGMMAFVAYLAPSFSE